MGKFFLKLLIFSILPIIILFSCTKRDGDRDTNKSGILQISYGEISINDNITSIGTKAAPTPSIGDFTLKITPYSSGDGYEGAAKEGVIKLLADRYNVNLSYGTDYTNSVNAPFSLSPYYAVNQDILIESGITSIITLNASFKGSILKVNIPQSLSQHFKSYSINVNGGSGSNTFSTTLNSGSQLFLKGGMPVTVTLTGINSIDQNTSISLFSSEGLPGGVISDKTEYIINASLSPSIPTLTLPGQLSYNSWATKHIITTATISSGDNSKIIYEAIPSSSSDWSQAIVATSVNPIFTLPPSSTEVVYKMRGRYGVIYSNEVLFTSEKIQQLENGDFSSSVTNSKGSTYGSKSNFNYYSFAGWATQNSTTLNGVDGKNLTTNVGTKFKWDSAVQSDNGKVYLKTMGLYNSKIGQTFGLGKTRTSYIFNQVSGNGTIWIGTLTTTSGGLVDDINQKTSHSSRPSSISFDLTYTPYNASDRAVMIAEIYDTSGAIIATASYNSAAASSVVPIAYFNYTNTTSKAGYIKVTFKSGTVGNDWSYLRHIAGGYNSYPWGDDRVTGSEMWIDNVVLNY